MSSVARGARADMQSGGRALISAMRLDLDYLFADGVFQYPLIILMPFVFLLAFRNDFGYVLGVSMETYSFGALIVTMAVVDVQSGYRLRALMPVARHIQVLSRYVLGVMMAVIAAVMVTLLNLVQSLAVPDWSLAANMPMVVGTLLSVLAIVAIWIPLGYRSNSVNGLQVGLLVVYVIFLAVLLMWSELPHGFTASVLGVFAVLGSHAVPAAVAGLAIAVALYAVSYAISARIYQRKEW